MLHKWIGVFLLSMGFACVAHSALVAGSVVDAETGMGLAGVHFQSVDGQLVWYTDSLGFYRWDMSGRSLEDSIRISSVGYQTQMKSLRELISAQFMLSPRNYVLPEVSLKGKKAKTKWLNDFPFKSYAERSVVVDLYERQTDWIGRPFYGSDAPSRYTRIRSIKVVQEVIQTSHLDWHRKQQTWRFRLRIFKADNRGLPSSVELLQDRFIVTVADVFYKDFDPKRFDERGNSTLYSNFDYSQKSYFGLIELDLRPYDLAFPETGVFVFLELLPPVIEGSNKLFRVAKGSTGRSGWFKDGRTLLWSRGLHPVLQSDGRILDVPIEPAISLQLSE